MKDLLVMGKSTHKTRERNVWQTRIEAASDYPLAILMLMHLLLRPSLIAALLLISSLVTQFLVDLYAMSLVAKRQLGAVFRLRELLANAQIAPIQIDGLITSQMLRHLIDTLSSEPHVRSLWSDTVTGYLVVPHEGSKMLQAPVVFSSHRGTFIFLTNNPSELTAYQKYALLRSTARSYRSFVEEFRARAEGWHIVLWTGWTFLLVGFQSWAVTAILVMTAVIHALRTLYWQIRPCGPLAKAISCDFEADRWALFFPFTPEELQRLEEAFAYLGFRDFIEHVKQPFLTTNIVAGCWVEVLRINAIRLRLASGQGIKTSRGIFGSLRSSSLTIAVVAVLTGVSFRMDIPSWKLGCLLLPLILLLTAWLYNSGVYTWFNRTQIFGDSGQK